MTSKEDKLLKKKEPKKKTEKPVTVKKTDVKKKASAKKKATAKVKAKTKVKKDVKIAVPVVEAKPKDGSLEHEYYLKLSHGERGLYIENALSFYTERYSDITIKNDDEMNKIIHAASILNSFIKGIQSKFKKSRKKIREAINSITEVEKSITIRPLALMGTLDKKVLEYKQEVERLAREAERAAEAARRAEEEAMRAKEKQISTPTKEVALPTELAAITGRKTKTQEEVAIEYINSRNSAPVIPTNKMGKITTSAYSKNTKELEITDMRKFLIWMIKVGSVFNPSLLEKITISSKTPFVDLFMSRLGKEQKDKLFAKKEHTFPEAGVKLKIKTVMAYRR